MVAYERYVFRQMAQKPSERLSDFTLRLRIQAKRCDFLPNVLEEMIIDQITEKGNSDTLRMEILKRDVRSLNEIIALGTAMSESKVKSMQMTNKGHAYREEVMVQSVKQQRRGNFVYPSRTPVMNRGVLMTCHACGHPGHLKASKWCPAIGIKCNRCHQNGHYAKFCSKFNQPQNQEPLHRHKRSFYEAGRTDWHNPPAKRIRTVTESNVDCQEDANIFYAMGRNVFHFRIGGVIVPMTIDSGADANIIPVHIWQQLKRVDVQAYDWSRQPDRILKAYASSEPLKVKGMFNAEIEAGDNTTKAKFYVVEGGKQCLLGEETARELQVLKIGFNVGAIDQSPKEFPKVKGVLLEIPIDPTVQPVQQPYRRAPITLEGLIAEKLQFLLEQGIIERVTQPSAWVSPLVPVLKDSGEVRLCVDMRRANRAVLREKHPLPVIEELLGSINGAVRFSKVDIKDAYHQIEISERSREITTFISKYGLFRYKRLMFGVCSAPELFQKVMETIVAGLEGVVVYLDDLVVFGKSEEEHATRLQTLLDRLEEYGILLNSKKCLFNVNKLEFLGHELSEKGIRPTESRVKAIEQFRSPSNIAELRSFLGLVTYVGRFVPNLASKTDPLRDLLRKGTLFKWSNVHQNAFDSIKAAISSVDFLRFFDPKDTSFLIVDASPTGLGAVLLQANSKNEKRIIAFASKALTDLERKYFQTEREALALVWAIEKFRLYLLGATFKLITDCKPLDFLFSPRSKPCPRIERWVLRVQSYRFDVIYQPGATNLADALSRLSVSKPEPFDDEHEAFIKALVATTVPKAVTVQEIEKHTEQDTSLQELISVLDGAKWTGTVKCFKPFESELYRSGNILMRGNRLIVPEALRSRVLELAHETHLGIVSMKRRLRQKVWWPGIDKQVEMLVKKCKSCTIVSALDPPEPLKSTNMPERPWVDLSADFVGPLPSGDNLLVIVDYFSRFIEVVVLKQTTASLTVKALHETFCRFGMPESLKTDNGPQFRSDEFKNFCNQYGIKLRNSTPYWPQANGEVERVNGMLKKHLKISQVEDTDWKWDLRMCVLTYNSTPHSTTGVAPSVLMFGRVMKDKLPSISVDSGKILEEVKDRDREQKQKSEEYTNVRRHARNSNLQSGDIVVVKRPMKEHKLASNFSPEEWEIIDKNGSDVTLRSKISDRVIHRNTAHLKRLHSRDDEDVQISSEDDGAEGVQDQSENILVQ
ncbi:uncharacterized protein K02A2.6-like [Toxorhynchites rutilus septentrionalis]|uniref:uncharacterized protein K02A2.6-like n=1 Tax=Toxorhynchites rutilus septentrionalis TaxID=329112 RepID=UPI00247B24BA|nr:uncharacterized protein K02A2.6-like [Toxorhynchites rutilus septentrionalis]